MSGPGSKASPTSTRTRAVLEDEALGRIFEVSLKKCGTNATPVYLESLVEEIESEGLEPLLSDKILERVLMERLSFLPPSVTETPLQYLISCYRRALDESRRASSVRDKEVAARLQETITLAKDLLVSYTGLILQHSYMFPQPERGPKSKNPLSLVEIILAEGSGSSAFGLQASSGAGLPSGFLDHLVKRFEEEGLDAIFDPVFSELPNAVTNMSALGEFQAPLKVLVTLVAYPALAKVMVNHKKWLPVQKLGRLIEIGSILGPFFRIGCLIDFLMPGEPDVLRHFDLDGFPPSTGSQRSAAQGMQAVRSALHTLYGGLSQVMLTLLRNTETREKALEFLAVAIETNRGRSKLQMDPMSSASHSFFMSLSVVLLKLSEPFMDPSSNKKDRIDPTYVLSKNRLDFTDVTALAASSQEVAAWGEKTRASQQEATSTSGSGASPPKFHFICECFFLTARTLHLGLVKILSEHKQYGRELYRYQDKIEVLEGLEQTGELGLEQKRKLAIYKEKAKKCMQIIFTFDTVLNDTELMQSAMSFYRLVSVWLANLAGGLQAQLPLPVPIEFAAMPEHFVEDMCEVFGYVSATSPRALEGQVLEEMFLFMVVFMGTSSHIKNPYLRSRFVQFLSHVLPNSLTRQPGIQSIMVGLFEGHNLSLQVMVPNLLRLYVDSESTGSHNQFYEKFQIRSDIARTLEYLWGVPSHRKVWLEFAREEESKFYLRFISMLVNDSIFLLDESIKKLPEARELEVELADNERWVGQTEEARLEREEALHQVQSIIRSDMHLAGKQLHMLGYMSTEITRPFLLPEMVERIATMLNYFLYQLVGPQRRELKVKDPEKYEFRPKELLGQIMDIYVNLGKADSDEAFATAIGMDERSYREEAFVETAAVIRNYLMRPEESVRAFLELGERVKRCKLQAMDTEAALGDIPEEFLDPIQYTLMKDPVLLPSSKVIVDRSVIQRHLLSDQNDPFNRSPLTIDMLEPATDLKARIEAFLAAHRP